MQDKIVSFLESIPAGIFFFTGNGEFESVNHAFCQFTGYSKEELAGRWVKEFWFPEDIHGVGADQNQSGNEDLGILEGERAYIHKAGHIVWGDLRVRPLHDKEETPCYVGILTDITEKK